MGSDEEILQLQLEMIREFGESAPDLFNDILEVENKQKKTKSDLISAEYREKGNKLYQMKKLHEATAEYNSALLYANSGSVLALAYANRSAVLFQRNEIKACYRDIERAMVAGYPENLLYKLWDRKGKCLMKVSRFVQATEAFEKCLESMPEALDQVPQSLKTLAAQVEKSIKACQGRQSVGVDPFNNANENLSRIPSLSFGANPLIPSFSKAIKLDYSSHSGRFGSATRKIECGEIVSVDKSPFKFASIEQRSKLSFCTHCLGHCIDLMPSPISVNDFFCCKSCLDVAMQTYHPGENQLFWSLEQLELVQEEWFIAFRAILSKPLSWFINNRKELFVKEDPTGKEAKVYNSDDYKSIYNLQTHLTDWSLDHMRRKSLVTHFFLKCLRKVKYFGDQADNDDKSAITRDETFILEILLHLMNVASTNSIEVGLFQVDPDKSALEGRVDLVGSSLDVSLGLLNHSCDPNTIRFNSNGRVVLMANRTIAEGEEVTASYSSSYAEADLETRQAYLQRKYFFKCNCDPCLKDWPTLESLPKSFNDIGKGQLLIDEADTMKLVQQVNKIQKLGANISLEQKKGQFEKALGQLLFYITIATTSIVIFLFLKVTALSS